MEHRYPSRRSTRLALLFAAFIGLMAGTSLAAEPHATDAPVASAVADPPAAPMPTITLPDGRTADVAWAPNPGPQTKFLASTANEVLYGGAAGGGKSAALIAAPLRWVDNGNFRALILRRETTQLNNLLDKAQALYPKLFPGIDYNGTSHTYTFPSGAKVRFNHCQHEKDAFNYQGDEFQLVEFDELTHFTRPQYLEIKSRVRSTDPTLPRYIRSSTNPGGEGHEWVFKRWGPWLDPKFEAEGLPPRFDEVTGARLPPAAPGQVLYFLVDKKTGEERIVPKGTLDAKGAPAQSRTFIPAKLEDNPQLLQGDPGYEQNILSMDPVRRAQLLNGDWLIKPAAGLYFKRDWFTFVDAPPAQASRRVRYWDLAGSPDGDWAVGARLAKTADGIYVVEHVHRLRGTPGEVRAAVKATAELDGKGVEVWLEQDPGQAGKDQMQTYATMLAGWTVRPRPKRADKVTAAGPFSSQAQAGNVRIVRGQWNEPFIAEIEGFPDEKHDDQVDAASGAFSVLAGIAVPISRADLPKLNTQSRSI